MPVRKVPTKPILTYIWKFPFFPIRSQKKGFGYFQYWIKGGYQNGLIVFLPYGNERLPQGNELPGRGKTGLNGLA